jgi:hypothetical protein
MSTVNTQLHPIETAAATAAVSTPSAWNHVCRTFELGSVPALAMRCAL